MSIDPSTERFELSISVNPTDIDELGHVNNVVYLRWVQEVATAHWRSRATQEQKSELIWVVVWHEIDYKHPALAEDKVIAVRGWELPPSPRLNVIRKSFAPATNGSSHGPHPLVPDQNRNRSADPG